MKVLALITLLTITLTQTLSAQNFDSAVAANKRGDYKTAIKHLRPLAEKGLPEAQALLGAMYAHERGVGDHRILQKLSSGFVKALHRITIGPSIIWVICFPKDTVFNRTILKPQSGSGRLPIKVTSTRRVISELCT